MFLVMGLIGSEFGRMSPPTPGTFLSVFQPLCSQPLSGALQPAGNVRSDSRISTNAISELETSCDSYEEHVTGIQPTVLTQAQFPMVS